MTAFQHTTPNTTHSSMWIARVLLSLLISLLFINQAGAKEVLYPDGSVRYSALSQEIPSVAITQGDLCDITLQAGEHINQAIISDSLRWKMTDGISGSDTPHVFIKPISAGLHALLTVTTSRRTYHLRLTSTHENGREYIGFYYPKSNAERERDRLNRPRAPKIDPAWTCGHPLFGHYHVWGNPAFLPVSVCTDGQRTYVNMRHIDGALPVLVTVADGNHDQIVGNPIWQPAHNEFIIDGSPRRLALLRDSRHGQLRVTILRTDQ